MNPGPVEEVSKTANTFMDIMRAQPLSLALVIMNMALLLFFYIILDRLDKRAGERERLVTAEQKEIRELLSKCIVPKANVVEPEHG